MNLAGLVILYNPDDDLLKRINTYQDRVKKLYIVDNSNQPNNNHLKKILLEEKVLFIHDGINKGIGKRLNQAANLAITEGYDWLLTMDQDSFFDKGVLDRYISCVSLYSGIEKTAMFGMEYDEKLLSEETGCEYKPSSHLITSGSLVNLKLFDAIGGFNEAYFIDHVDHEYCFRSIQKGYKIIQLNNLLLNHSIGTLSLHRSLKNGKLTQRSLHSPVRIYYMVRNYIHLSTVYSANFQDEMIYLRKHLFNRIKNNLLYNRRRYSVLKYIIKGFLDSKKLKH